MVRKLQISIFSTVSYEGLESNIAYLLTIAYFTSWSICAVRKIIIVEDVPQDRLCHYLLTVLNRITTQNVLMDTKLTCK